MKRRSLTPRNPQKPKKSQRSRRQQRYQETRRPGPGGRDRRPTLPRYFHIGMPKSGSIFLTNLFRQHPDITINEMQKNFYAALFDKGFDWYTSQFPGFGDKTAIDLSNRLFMLGSKAVPRIKKYVRDPKFLLILRSPANFVYSYYRMHYNKGFFLREHRDLFKKNPSFDDLLAKYPAYLERGNYYQLFKIWLRYFDLSCFKVIIFEDFVKNPQEVMDEICDFFQVKRIKIKPVGEASMNVSLRSPLFHKIKMIIVKRERLKNQLKKIRLLHKLFDFIFAKPTHIPADHKRKLQDYYRDDVKKLSQLLKIDLELWLK